MTEPLTHRLTVAIDPACLDELDGLSLYAFLGFQTSNSSAVPLVFGAKTQLAQSMNFAWTESYGGFASQTLLSEGVSDPSKRTIELASSAPAQLGQALTLSSTFGFDATTDGQAGALTFRNGRSAEATCGLCYGDGLTPVCAARLIPGIDLVIAPVQIVFLMLSSSRYDEGSWVFKSQGKGVMVDMTGADARTVTFDIAAPDGWRETANIWAQPVPPGTALAGLLRKVPKRNMSRMARL
ncbi:MAG: hypothetical protein ACXW27_07440 [Allosphingosinicella sp.]